MGQIVDISAVQVESVYLVHRVGIEVMVVRRPIRIGPVNRIIIRALRVVQRNMRQIRYIHSPANVKPFEFPWVV